MQQENYEGDNEISAPPRRVAFFGLGLMGLPMARHLLKDPNTYLYVYNRSVEKVESLCKEYGPTRITGILAKDDNDKTSQYVSIQQVLNDSSITVVISMLFDYDSIQSTIMQHASNLKGKYFIQMSTISLDQSADLSRRTTELGGVFVEAPVLGTNTVAKQGNLQVLCGLELTTTKRTTLSPIVCKSSHFTQDKYFLLVNSVSSSGYYALLYYKGVEISKYMKEYYERLDGLAKNCSTLHNLHDVSFKTVT